MTRAVTSVGPQVRTGGRVDAIDLARGVALLAMMLVHVGPHWLDGGPPVGSIVASGRAAPLFALVAGVALALIHDREPGGAGSTRATAIRAVLLVALGLSLGSLHDMPILVILPSYGVMIVAALPFRRLSTRAVLILAGAWAVVVPVLLLAAQRQHSPVFAEQAELSDLEHPGGLVMELLVWGPYPAAVWFAYVLAGLGLGRLDLRSAVVARRMVLVGAALVTVTLATGWAAISLGTFGDDGRDGWHLLFRVDGYPYELPMWNDLLIVGEHTSRPLNVLGAMGSSVLVVGACALVSTARIPGAWFVLAPVRAAGAMTLSLYTIHVLWSWRLRVTSDELAAGLPPVGGYDDWLLQVVVLCAAAVLWRRFLGRGPLESAVRRLSVWGSGRSSRTASRGLV